jgi:hypothetical protein
LVHCHLLLLLRSSSLFAHSRIPPFPARLRGTHSYKIDYFPSVLANAAGLSADLRVM